MVSYLILYLLLVTYKVTKLQKRVTHTIKESSYTDFLRNNQNNTTLVCASSTGSIIKNELISVISYKYSKS